MISRRTMLTMGAVGCASSVLQLSNFNGLTLERTTTQVLGYVNFCRKPKDAAIIGREIIPSELLDLPAEIHITAIESLLRKYKIVEANQGLQASLRKAITEDYLQENTIYCNDWLLSEVEARLYAITSIEIT